MKLTRIFWWPRQFGGGQKMGSGGGCMHPLRRYDEVGRSYLQSKRALARSWGRWLCTVGPNLIFGSFHRLL